MSRKYDLLRVVGLLIVFEVLFGLLVFSRCYPGDWESMDRQDWDIAYPFGVGVTHHLLSQGAEISPIKSALVTTGLWYTKELLDEMCKKGYLDHNAVIFDKQGYSSKDLRSIAIGVASGLALDYLIYLKKRILSHPKRFNQERWVKYGLAEYRTARRLEMRNSGCFSKEMLIKPKYRYAMAYRKQINRKEK